MAVATAYSDLVNDRLADFLRRSGFEVLSMKGFGLTGFGDAANQSEQDIIDLSGKAIDEAGSAEAVLISCGGLKTLGCAVPIEQRHGIPVVTSTQSALLSQPVMIDGRHAGTWRRTIPAKASAPVRLDVQLLGKSSGPQSKAVQAAATRYGAFLDREVSLQVR